MLRYPTVLAIAAALGCGSVAAPTPAPAPTPVDTGEAPTADRAEATETASADPALAPAIADGYREIAERIIAAARSDQGAWDKLAHLTDRIGPRLSGSKALEQAVAWAAETMRADGHEGVHTEKAMVPHWVRGEESGALVAPVVQPLRLIGLGGTVATPRRGIEAEVVVVSDFAEIDELGDRIKGKIVLFNRAMPAFDEEKGSGYGETVEYRTAGPSRAAAHGAVASLVRSVTAHSLRTPHTGALSYADGVEKIPAAAITVEDAELIARLAKSGERVRVRLRLSGRTLKDAESANVIAELRGREKPEEIVLIGAHIDSWDVGQGAHDDGAGCAIMMQALTTLRRLGLRPRRTIRVVLFTNEENGLRGAIQYAIDHKDEVGAHVAAMEADSGGFAPRGFEVQGEDRAVERVRDIASLLEALSATRARPGFGGADLIPLARAGVPALGLWVDESKYFDYHHTEADTLDKVDPAELADNVAAVAIMAYVLADMDEPLAKTTPEPPKGAGR